MTVDRPACRHGAHSAAGHAQNAQSVIIHTDQVACIIALIQRQDLGRGFNDLLAGQILQQVNLVDALMGQRAHSGLVLIKIPGFIVHRPALGAGIAQDGAERDDVADHAGVQQFLRLAMDRVKAHIMAHHQVFAVALRRGHHGLTFSQRDRHGLFAQNMLAAVKSSRGDLGMAAVFHADGHRIDLRILQQVEIVFICRAAILSRHLLGSGQFLVIVAHQLHIGI